MFFFFRFPKVSNISGMQYSAEQMETLLTAFLNDLELLGLDVKLGDLPVQDKLIIILPIWHQNRARIAAIRGPDSMAADQMGPDILQQG